MAGGRPTEYKAEYADLARKFCLLGADDKILAEYFDITETTIQNWKLKHPQFIASIKEGREVADAKVADSLYKRALGYSHEDEEIFNNKGKIIRAKTKKHYPPDATSAIFWLKNRRKLNWRDQHNHAVGGDNDAAPIKTENVTNAADIARRVAFLLASGAAEIDANEPE